MNLRKDQQLLLLAAGITLLVWIVPLLRPLILPLEYFNTHIHELAHALTAIATGGQVKYILVHADGSGVTPISGGWIVPVASAGYVGSTLAGAALIIGSRTEKAARIALTVTFALLAMSMLLFVRGDIIGFISGIFWVAATGAGAKFLKQDALVFVVRFLGFTLCLTSFRSFLSLLNLTVSSNAQTDATLLQRATFIPAVLWAAAWFALAAIALFFSLKSAWNPPKQSQES